ncbi:UNVERIFIED_CONTAM: hypothetical protein FKN15_004033 [Acipenser sinensis]
MDEAEQDAAIINVHVIGFLPLARRIVKGFSALPCNGSSSLDKQTQLCKGVAV